MELNDIKTRDDLRTYWQQVNWQPVWNAQEVEEVRRSLLPIAKDLKLEDWVRYLDAREGYDVDFAASEIRLTAFVEWARDHRQEVEDWLFAHALFNLGVMQGELNKTIDALRNHDEVIASFQHDDDKNILIVVARTLHSACFYAGMSDNFQTGDKYLSELRGFSMAHDEPAIRDELAGALRNASSYAAYFGHMGAANRHIDELRKLAKGHNESVIREELARALRNVGYFAGEAGDMSTMGKHLDELRKLAKGHNESPIWAQLATALRNAAFFAGEADEMSVVTKHLYELRNLFKEYDEPTIRVQLAMAVYNYSISLESSVTLGEDDKIYNAYVACSEAEELLRQLTDDDTKPFRERVAIRTNRLRNELGYDGKAARELTPEELALAARERLITNLDNVIKEFSDVKDHFLAQMGKSKLRVEHFLSTDGRFEEDASVLMVLRQWNSYTPIIVNGQESDRGGGYFVRHKNVGLVIDPGYNFIELFHQAGCKIVDITHVAITHAHDDHTAQLEQLLTMFHQFNSKNKNVQKKVTLLLNHSTLKKFSGFSLHKDCPYIGKIICLNAFDPVNLQAIKLTESGELSLTVLPANHDDVFTTAYAVGLGLRISYGDYSRSIVFTGDTGLYPLARDKNGELVYYEYADSQGRPAKERRVTEKEDDGVNRLYPDDFRGSIIDLLVPHMGSIKEYEFNPQIPKPIPAPRTPNGSRGASAITSNMEPMFYPNHLGLLGAAIVIKELKPTAVILSEFGSELRGLRMKIANLLSEALEGPMDGQVPFIIPGDPSIVYNIKDGTFLCHDDGKFRLAYEIEPKEVGGDRIGLFKKGSLYASLERFDNYREQLVNSKKEDAEPFKLSYMRLAASGRP